jgi:hypothetical protein
LKKKSREQLFGSNNFGGLMGKKHSAADSHIDLYQFVLLFLPIFFAGQSFKSYVRKGQTGQQELEPDQNSHCRIART